MTLRTLGGIGALIAVGAVGCGERSALELLAVKRAVRLGTEENWSRLADNTRRTENVTDPQELAQLDLDFHQTIVEATGHSRLLSSWLNLRSQIRLIMVGTR